MEKITPMLWFAKEAEEAARFYTSIFPDSKIERVVTVPGETPSGPEGSVKVVDFRLFGEKFQAMAAGPLDTFNHSISFVIKCGTQAELDKYYDALLAGGSAEDCGWVKDRFGVSWQVVPSRLDDMIGDSDRVRGRRVTEAMLKMKKLDFAKLEAAFRGDGAEAQPSA